MKFSPTISFERVEQFPDFIHEYFVEDFMAGSPIVSNQRFKNEKQALPKKKVQLLSDRELNAPDVELMHLESERLSAVHQQAIRTNGYAPA